MLSEEQLSFDSSYVFSQGRIIDQKKNKITMETQKHLQVFSSPCLFLTLLNVMNGSSHVEIFSECPFLLCKRYT